MNTLRGWGMSGYLPYSIFKWLTQKKKIKNKKINNFDVNSIREISSTGYILEADLKYPNELQKLHKDYPLAPEILAIPYDMLSDNCKKIADKYAINVGDVKK